MSIHTISKRVGDAAVGGVIALIATAAYASMNGYGGLTEALFEFAAIACVIVVIASVAEGRSRP
jgi:sugar phosphate permease